VAARKSAKRAKPGGGRGAPPTDPALVAAGLDLVRLGRSPEEAAEELAAEGRPVSSRTLRRAGATTRGGVSPSAPSPPSPTASSPAAPPAPALPQGGAVSGRPDLLDLLDLLRRIGKARNAAAWAEVEEGLRVHVAGGEEALAPWLTRPVEAVEVGVDELAALGRGLDLAVEVMQRAEPGGPALRALMSVASLGKSVATVKARRPHVEGPDEVTRRLVGVRDAAIERTGLLTSDRAAKFATDRTAFDARCASFGAFGAEMKGLVDAMLGGASS
jgi:hypothetical protein